MTAAPKTKKLKQRFVLVFIAVAVAMVASGYTLYRADVDRTILKAGENLTAIGMLKADQILGWRNHKAFTSWRLAQGKYLGYILDGSPVPPLPEELRLDLRRQKDPGSEVFFFSTDGRLLLGTSENAVGQTPDPSMPELRKAMDAALAGKETVATDLVTGADGMFYVDFVTAVRNAAGKPTGLLVLRSDVSELLSPAVLAWPVPTDTAETLLIRREGDTVVNLNTLRHAPYPPLSKSFGIDQTDMPAVQAALGRVGIFAGLDYRGEPVLADVRPVPGSPWFIVSKIDMREVFADQPRRLALTGIIIGLLILLAASLIVSLYRGRQAKIERALNEAESRFRSYVEHAPEGIFVSDENGLLVDMNPAAERMSGYSLKEMVGKHISDIHYEEDKAVAREMFQRLRTEGQASGDIRHVTKAGGTRTWHIRAVMPDEHRVVGFVSDVGDMRETEQLVQLNTRRAEALLKLADAIETMKESDFMSYGQELAEDLTGSRISFVHFINEDEQTIELVAWSRRTLEKYCHAAFDRHYPVEKAGIWADALRQRRPVVVNDYASHPRKHGLPEGHSELVRLVSVPVLEGGRVVMLAGVGNKKTAYSDWDVRTVQLIANQIWSLVQRRRGIAALAASESRLRHLIDALPVPFAINTGEGVVSYVNDAFTRAFGYTVADIPTLDTWWQKAYPDPSYREGIKALWRSHAAEAARTHKLLEPVEASIVCKDGTCSSVLASAARLNTDNSGDVVVNLVDITQRKATEDELLRLRAAVEQSANIIVITNTEGTIEYVNPAFEQATGYTAREAIGQNPKILGSGEQDAEYYRQLWTTLLSGRSWRGQFHNKRKDGSLFWEFATISPVVGPDGQIRSFIAVKQDITDRKAMEQDLLEAKDRAEAASRAKSEFLAVMSHELRTPLNGVLGFAELLADSPLDGEQVEFVRTIRRSGNHLLQVVNDILDFSSIEEKGVSLHASVVVVSFVAEGACDAVRAAALEKGLDLRLELDPQAPATIWGDALRIRQILINLLGNAVKFTAAGSVVLEVAPVFEGGRSFVDFAVSDTGVGIAPEILPLLFQPFTQGDSTLRRRFEGTGLGLAISQRLAKAMGSEIRVVSALGSGSTFTLRIPVEASAISGAAPAAEPRTDVPPKPRPAPGDRRKVLVVEDDAVSRTLAGKLLESFGYEVESASDGKKAVAAFAPGKFFAVLMDMQMPKMDGIAATLAIRAGEAEAGSPRVPIIALTANVMPGDRERCIGAGMDDFLSKPVRRDELGSLLERFARRS